MKILIAEDDTASRILLQRTIQRLGHECYSARDGMEAWEIFKSSGAEVIISDWLMPGMDGSELCRRVRSVESSYTYFIFLTALSDKEHFLAGMREGADDYLSKPFERSDLEVRLVAAARVTTLHQQLRDQKAELERLNSQLFDQARTDPLTQLGNRLRLREDLERLRARADRYGHSYCAALCDVDFFKSYNDYYGHLAGDDVLRKVAHKLVELVRSGDAVYRYGGEEFLLILPEQPLESAVIALERMRGGVEELSIPHSNRSSPGVITISAGVAGFSGVEQKDIFTVLKEADVALYQAKEKGRNCVVAYSSTLNDTSVEASR